MTQTLTTLVKVAKHRVERAQEALGAAERKALEVAQWLQAAEASRRQSLLAALELEDIQQRMDATLYDGRLKQTVERLKGDLMQAEAVVTEKREALAVEYAAQERYKLLLAQEEQKIKLRRAGKQQAQLDDIAGQRFRRDP